MHGRRSIGTEETQEAILVVFHLIYREILHRKINLLLSLLAIVIAVALFVSFYTTGQASIRETIKIVRDMGFNLRIIPKETNMSEFWAKGFSESTMPEETVFKFASQKNISYNHLVATLQKKVRWRDKEAILTGVSPEFIPPGKEKAPMGFKINKGTVYVGFELAQSLGLKRKESIELLGKSFTIEKCLPDSGTDDNIRIYGHLHDVQEILNLHGRINEIKALECLCDELLKAPSASGRMDILREELSRLLPDAKVVELRDIATVRMKQRGMADRYFALIMPFVAVVCAAWIGVLAMMNVRERRNEIGILRAFGFESGKVATLFLGKAILVGVLGAVIGFMIGTGLAIKFGSKIFPITVNLIKPLYELLGWSLLVSPIFVAFSSFIPAMIAVTQDPADILRGE